MYIICNEFFLFCETTESKNRIHAFDNTVVRGCGMYEKLVNLYKMKAINRGEKPAIGQFLRGILP